MNTPTHIPSTPDRLPGNRRTLFRGLYLGLLATLIGGCLMAVVYLVNLYVTSLENGYLADHLALMGWEIWLLGFALATIGFSLVGLGPGLVGGAVIALVLRRFAKERCLTMRTWLTTGLLVGLGAGSLAIAFAFIIIPPQGHHLVSGGPIQTVVFTSLIAALAGLFHSRLLGNWLTRQMA